MSRPLVCDNPACEVVLRELEGDGLPAGWVTVSEIDADGDDVEIGECCSRSCASALLTMEVAGDAGV